MRSDADAEKRSGSRMVSKQGTRKCGKFEITARRSLKPSLATPLFEQSRASEAPIEDATVGMDTVLDGHVRNTECEYLQAEVNGPQGRHKHLVKICHRSDPRYFNLIRATAAAFPRVEAPTTRTDSN